MPDNPLKPGSGTSELAETKSAGILAIVGLVLAGVVTLAPQFIDKLDGKTAAIAGAVLGACAIGLKLLTTLGYVKSRTVVKAKAEEAKKTV